MQYYHYFVEGKTEERMIGVLKTYFQCIVPGKTRVFNVVVKKIPKTMILTLKPKTNVVLVFDTDVGNSDILKTNISFLKNLSTVHRVICIPQVANLEDELVRSCEINLIKELLPSKSNKDFKNDFCKSHNLDSALRKHSFNIALFWSSQPQGDFSQITNDSVLIKKHYK